MMTMSVRGSRGPARAGRSLSSAPKAVESGRSLKTSEVVAQRIVRDIRSQQLVPGDHLPSEAAMLAEYRVSRTSLREALRLLEVQGLISMRFGPGGGPAVGTVDPRHLARTHALYLHLDGLSYRQLYATWIAQEGLCAELAARHADREARRELLGPYLTGDGAGRHDSRGEVGDGFHERVFELTGNRAVSLLTASIAAIVQSHVVDQMDIAPIVDRVAAEHVQLARAIVDGRPRRAKELAEAHFGQLAEYFDSRWPELSDELVAWR